MYIYMVPHRQIHPQADIIKSMQIAQRLTTMSFSETITWASILEDISRVSIVVGGTPIAG